MAAVLTFFLLSNVYRCAKIVMGDYFKKVPPRMYWDEAKFLVTHFCTQKEFGKCADRQRIVHLAIMTGYATVFLLVIVFVNGLPFAGVNFLMFQRGWESLGGHTEFSIFHPIRLLGYYSFCPIMYERHTP